MLINLAFLSVGFLFGLLGYSQARRRALRDFIAASQRSRLAILECRQ